MAIVPLLFTDWWEDLDRPHSILDQSFGSSINSDLLSFHDSPRSEVLVYRPHRHPKRFHPLMHHLLRKHQRSAVSRDDKDKFTVTLDVHQFAPEEITVKVVDQQVVVEAKHEEKEDEHGYISRQFVRKYQIPQNYNIEEVESHLSSDGILSITAPSKESQKKNEKTIKIQFTGEPAITPAKSSTSMDAQQNQSRENQQQLQRGRRNTVKAA